VNKNASNLLSLNRPVSVYPSQLYGSLRKNGIIPLPYGRAAPPLDSACLTRDMNYQIYYRDIIYLPDL